MNEEAGEKKMDTYLSKVNSTLARMAVYITHKRWDALNKFFFA